MHFLLFRHFFFVNLFTLLISVIEKWTLLGATLRIFTDVFFCVWSENNENQIISRQKEFYQYNPYFISTPPLILHEHKFTVQSYSKSGNNIWKMVSWKLNIPKTDAFITKSRQQQQQSGQLFGSCTNIKFPILAHNIKWTPTAVYTCACSCHF